jgi:hypothetical protein
MNNPTYYIDDTSRTTRIIETPNADWSNGVNSAGSNAMGIGIANDQAGLADSLPNWTLLDQHGAARAPQNSQHIGGNGLGDGVSGVGTTPVRLCDNVASGIGGVTPIGDATLVDLAIGWAIPVPPLP